MYGKKDVNYDDGDIVLKKSKVIQKSQLLKLFGLSDFNQK